MFFYNFTGNRRIKLADARIQQANKIIHLRHAANGGTRVAGRNALLDCNSRTNTSNIIYIGLFHTPQKLPGIAGKAFNIAALPLRVKRIHRNTGLAGAGNACYNHEFIFRDAQVDIAQIIRAGAFDTDM